MPLPKSKATKPDRWGALFVAELARKETVFPADSLSIKQICELRNKAGLACGERATSIWLKKEKELGNVKMIRGRSLVNGAINNAVRYVIA